MLNTQIIQDIEEFVYSKPRVIQEIAQHIKKSWRTTDRYVEEIKKEHGTIETRTFREGTRGALKLVYWSSVEKTSQPIFQDKLAHDIESFRKKEDFSAFDIYQHIPDKDKKAISEKTEEEQNSLIGLKESLNKTKKQLLIFSGNLSWINLKHSNLNTFSMIEELVERGVSIKIVCRVDLISLSNIERILSLNFKHGKELIEIRHSEQPVRGMIIDNQLMRLKEVKEPTGKINELNKKLFIYYIIKNKEWTEWLSRVFWKIFSNSIDANKRIQQLKTIKGI